MWVSSVFLKTLRDFRTPILGWGLGIGAMTPLIFALVPTLLADPQARAALEQLVRNPAIRAFADPVDVLTPAGYATWRLAEVLPILGVWALLATTRTVRGEEESGALDVLLSVPRSRLSVVIAKLGAVAAALLLMGASIGGLAFAGGRVTGTRVPPQAAMLFGLNAALLASVFGGVALLASQFTTARRTAAGVTGALLGLSIMMTSVGRTVAGAEWVGRLSPVYYFERSKPLVASVGTSPRAMIVLAGLTLVLGAAGMSLFVRRDVGGHVALPGSRRPAMPVPFARTRRAWRARSVLLDGLGALVPTMAGWSIALAVYAAGMTAILKQTQRSLMALLDEFARRDPLYGALIARFTGGDQTAINARGLTVVFTIIAVVFSACAVTLASRWAADEGEGRLDLVLTTPHRRAGVMLARFTALTVALVAVAAVVFGAAGAAAWIASFTLNPGRLAQAAFGMIPIALVVAALGFLLAGWLGSAAVTGTLTALLLASFLVTVLGPLFKWPAAVMQLSLFEQYGTPLVNGLAAGRVMAQLAFAALAFTAATARFATKDLRR